MLKKLPHNARGLPFYIIVGVLFMSLWVLGDYVEERETFFARFINNIWRTSFIILANFLLFEFIVPRLQWKQFFTGLIMLFGQLMLFSFGLYGWRTLGIFLNIYTSFATYPTIEEGVTYHFPFSLASIFFFGIAKHIFDYRKLKSDAQELRIEKQEAELNYLKSQTNPHFLFNTLNNIYSLARDNSPLAPVSILKLSKMLRFMLYEAGGDYIAIEHELKIIHDYIDLEKLRYDDSLNINFNHNVEDMKQSIPPLLLMPLVENAFKHGVSETRSNPFIDIHLTVNNRQLRFVVKNSSERQEDHTIRENIGLSNLRRQLELLYHDYELKVSQGNDVFTAVLQINLSSHV